MKETHSLYDSKYELVYDPDATKNRYIVDGVPVRGVTGALSDILHKAGLLLWPLNESSKYLFGSRWDEKYKKLVYDPSKAFLQPGIPYTQGDLQSALDASYGAHRAKADKSKDTGTLVHAAAEAFLKGEAPPSLTAEARRPFENFTRWFTDNKLKTVFSERIVYSPTLDYAGRPDALVKTPNRPDKGVNEQTILIDIKTSEPSPSGLRVGGKYTGIYPENLLQLAGYSRAYTEETGEEVDDLQVVNVTKSGQVHTLKASELGLTTSECEDAFNAAIFLHDWLAKVRKVKIGSPLPELELV